MKKKQRTGQEDIIGKIKIFFIITTIVVVFDRVSKYLSFNYLTDKVVLIPNFLELNFSLNTGAAFSMFTGRTFYLIIISLIFLCLIIFNISSILKEKYYFAVALVFGGAISNLFDRVAYNSVIDFISVRFFSIFNLADVAISIGAAIILFYVIQEYLIKK